MQVIKRFFGISSYLTEVTVSLVLYCNRDGYIYEYIDVSYDPCQTVPSTRARISQYNTHAQLFLQPHKEHAARY